MTIELQPNPKELRRRMAGMLIALPIFFIVVYPWLYLLLPERLQSLADLPQDLQLVLLAGLVVLPAGGAGWYAMERKRRWVVSERGVEIFRGGRLIRAVPWDRVRDFVSDGGGVVLKTGGGGRVTRLGCVERTAAAKALALYPGRRGA